MKDVSSDFGVVDAEIKSEPLSVKLVIGEDWGIVGFFEMDATRGIAIDDAV